MLSFALFYAYFCVGLALLLSAYRVLQGPDRANRILGLDTMYINVTALLVLLGIAQQLSVYFEAALLIALMGFIGTVAFCVYILRGDIIE